MFRYLTLALFFFKHVWECGCFLKCFSYRNASKWFFFIFKNYFWDQRIKTIQNILKKLIFNKKINKFWGNAVCTAFPNALLKPVWYCGGGCFSKYFSFEIHQNNIFFIFLKFIFENNSLKQWKNIKKNNLKKN